MVKFNIKSVSPDSCEAKELQTIIYEEWGEKEQTGIDDEDLYSICVLVEDGTERVLGGVILHKIDLIFTHWLFVSFLIIHKDYRNQKFGTKLIDHCKGIVTELVENGEKIDLALYSEEWNSRTRKFYEDRGFKFLTTEEGVYEENNGIACIYTWRQVPRK